MTNWNHTPTDRIDTTHTLVAVHGNDGTSPFSAAAHYVKKTFAAMRPNILAVYSTQERDQAGHIVYGVEWEDSNDGED